MATKLREAPSDFDLGVRSLREAAATLAEQPLEAGMPARSQFTPTYHLIRMHHMRSGATNWGREKFRRLCVAYNETIEEMGMRIGMSPFEIRQRMKSNRFSVTEGILLELHWRFIQESRTGVKPEGSALAPTND